MRLETRALVLLAALAVALPAAAIDKYDDGDPIPADKGVLLFSVEREKLKHSAVTRRGATKITLRQVGTDERVSFSLPTRIRGVVLSPGRWYLYSLDEVEGGLSADRISGPTESLVVEAGKATWAGKMFLQLGLSGTRITLVKGPDERKALGKSFKKTVAQGLVQKAELGGAPEPLGD